MGSRWGNGVWRPRLLAPILVTVALAFGAAPAAAYSDPIWKPDYKAAKDYARQRHHNIRIIGFTLRTPGHTWSYHGTSTVPGFSAVKVMIMTAYLRRADVRNRDLSSGEAHDLRLMIEYSDDHAADRVFAHVHCKGLGNLARKVGMKHFTACGPPGGFRHWGQSRIESDDQSLFLRDLQRYLPSRHRSYALKLMEHIHRGNWGIGDVHPSGWTVHFKSGWGCGTGQADNQVALLTRNGMRIGVAVILGDVYPDENSRHGGCYNDDGPYGQATLKGLFKRLLSGLGKNSLVQ
jgi:hypothetical protein